MAPLKKSSLGYKSKNSRLWDKTTIPHWVVLAFGFVESQHQKCLVRYCGFMQWPWVLAILSHGGSILWPWFYSHTKHRQHNHSVTLKFEKQKQNWLDLVKPAYKQPPWWLQKHIRPQNCCTAPSKLYIFGLWSMEVVWKNRICEYLCWYRMLTEDCGSLLSKA